MDDRVIVFVTHNMRTGRSSWSIFEPPADDEELGCTCSCGCNGKELCEDPDCPVESPDELDEKVCHCWHVGCICAEILHEV